MLKKKVLPFLLPLCLSLTACGGGSGSESDNVSNVPDGVTYNPPEISLTEGYDVLEGNVLRITPSVSVDTGLTYTLDWTMEDNDAISFSEDNNDGIVNTTAVSEDVVVDFTVTVKDSENNSDSASFTVTVKNEEITTIEEAIENLERTGVIPVLDQTDTLAGIDSDNDGVRDDVAQLIESSNVSTEQKEALTDLAKGIQSIMIADLSNEQTVKAMAADVALNSVCLVLVFDDTSDISKYSGRIEGAMANTAKRAAKYEAFSAAMHGSVTRLPDFSACM